MAAAVILAGGQGRRMGGAVKSLLPVGDGTVLDRQLAALAGVAAPVALSLASDDGPLAELARARGLPWVVDGDAYRGAGPLAGLAAALAWCPSDRLLVVAGDLPDLQPALLAHLLALADEADCVVPQVADRLQPLLAVYRPVCLPVLAARLAAAQLRLRDLPAALAAAGVRVAWPGEGELAAVDPSLASFFNWNHPADRS